MKKTKKLGRPSEGLTEQLTVHFTKGEMRAISVEARRDAVPFNTVVRRAVKERYKK